MRKTPIHRRSAAIVRLALIGVAVAAAMLIHPSPGQAQSSGGAAPPCLVAAQYAISRQGARYSQGGFHPRDPIDPATGRFYPRTGPWSFDCSGLVFAAYAAAGVTIGGTTETQSRQGSALPCTLAHLNGPHTTCWAPGDLIFLRNAAMNGSGRHVAIYVGNGLFLDCYNHDTGCILHDVRVSSYYQRHFWQARRIVSGCEALTLDPGVPIAGAPGQAPGGEAGCVPEEPGYPDTGVRYLRGCGPPVRPGDRLRQFDGVVGWIGPTGRAPPPGAAAHLELRVRFATTQVNVCRWPYQAPGTAPDTPPPGAWTCWSVWLDPASMLPHAHADSLHQDATGRPAPSAFGQPGDPQWTDAPMQLPPPGHDATLLWPATTNPPGGAWWSPGNDDRARNAACPLGGPQVASWMTWLIQVLLSWLLGC